MPGRPTAPRSTAAAADQTALGEFGDQGGRRRPGQPQLGRQCGPGPRAVVAQLPQDEAEVGVDRRHRPHLPTLLVSDRGHSFVRPEHKLGALSGFAQEARRHFHAWEVATFTTIGRSFRQRPAATTVELWRAACKDAPVRHSLAGRAETPVQARLLAQLRDEGPSVQGPAGRRAPGVAHHGRRRGRAPDRAGTGVSTPGPPRRAGGGGRRSSTSSPDIRFDGHRHRGDRGVGGSHGRPAPPRSRVKAPRVRHQGGSGEGARPRPRDHPQAHGRGGRGGPLSGAGVGVPGPVDFHRGVLGVAADHAGMGRLPGPRRIS